MLPTSICCQHARGISSGSPSISAHQISWLQPLDFAVLILKPSAVEQANRELHLKTDRAVLKPRFEQSDSLIYSLVATLLTEINLNGEGSCIYTETLFRTLAVHLFQQYAFPLIEETKETKPSFKIDKAIAYINENLDRRLSLEEIATAVNTSKYHFCRRFKYSMGISPYKYLLQQRIKRAESLLQSNLELSIADISLSCGFASQSHLCKCFRKFTGVTPKAYRNYQLGKKHLAIKQ